MNNRHKQIIEPLSVLPRFDSQEIFNEKQYKKRSPPNSIYQYNSSLFEDIYSHEKTTYPISQTKSDSQLTYLLLPKFQSHHQIISYDENQSADITHQTISKHSHTNQDVNYQLKNLNIKYFQQMNNRSSRNCQFMIYNNIEKSDLESAYTTMGDALESYIHFRKLSHCTALSNFIDYRNKIYKREKIGQYASLKMKTSINEEDTKQATTNSIHLKGSQITPSILADTVSLNNTPSSNSIIFNKISPKQSPSIIKEEYIQIPSPNLLREARSKSIKFLTTPKSIKQSSSPSIKGSSQLISNLTFKTKTVPKKTLLKKHNQQKRNDIKPKSRHKFCIVL